MPNSLNLSSMTIRDILSLLFEWGFSTWLNTCRFYAGAPSSDVVIVKNFGIPAKKQKPVSPHSCALFPRRKVNNFPKLLLPKIVQKSAGRPTIKEEQQTAGASYCVDFQD
jgi:hypothetical protein